MEVTVYQGMEEQEDTVVMEITMYQSMEELEDTAVMEEQVMVQELD